MSTIKKIIAIQAIALCAVVFLGSTHVYASEVTGTLSSDAGSNSGTVSGTVGGGSTVSGTLNGGTGDSNISGTVNGGSNSTISGTVNGGTDNTISGTVSGGGGGGGGGGSVGGTVSGGTGGNGLPLVNNGAVLGQSTTNPSITSGTNNTTPNLPNTGFGPPDDQTGTSLNPTLALSLIALGVGLALIAYGVFESRRQRRLL